MEETMDAGTGNASPKQPLSDSKNSKLKESTSNVFLSKFIDIKSELVYCFAVSNGDDVDIVCSEGENLYVVTLLTFR